MSNDFIEVYADATGGKQMVPEHFLTNPVLSKGLKPTAAGREQLRLNAGPSQEWTVEQLKDHAGPAGESLRSKSDLLDVIRSADQAPISSPGTGLTGTEVLLEDTDENPDTDPASANKE